jgi:hemolysin III
LQTALSGTWGLPRGEAAHCLSHALGGLAAAVVLPLLWRHSVASGAPVVHTAGVCAFALSMMLMYLSSALCHGLPAGAAQRRFDRIDRAAIYLFIAGSYSPFAAATLSSAADWAVFALVWLLALAGAAWVLWRGAGRPMVSTGMYLLLGWAVLLAAGPGLGRLPAQGLAWLIGGGVVYSLGAALFLLGGRWRHAHLAWHVAVLGGSGLHLAAVWYWT